MSVSEPRCVLAIDPGTRKCGIAIVRDSAPPQTLYRQVVETPLLPEAISPLLNRFPIAALLIGNATGAAAISRTLQPGLPETLPTHLVPEAYTSQKARVRWCQENPPRAFWERLFPGFRTPTEPVDDYAAVILAEEYLANQ